LRPFDTSRVEVAEDDKVGARLPPLAHRACLQAVEVAATELVEHANLAVEDVVTAKDAECVRDLGPPRGCVDAAARLQTHLAAVHFRQAAPTVVLDFVGPASA
jgi:hypothetical protein